MSLYDPPHSVNCRCIVVPNFHAAPERRTVTLVRRADGEVGTELDVTRYSERDFYRMWDGLVFKVDFEVWEPIYSPDRGDDQTIEDWLRGDAS